MECHSSYGRKNETNKWLRLLSTRTHHRNGCSGEAQGAYAGKLIAVVQHSIWAIIVCSGRIVDFAWSIVRECVCVGVGSRAHDISSVNVLLRIVCIRFSVMRSSICRLHSVYLLILSENFFWPSSDIFGMKSMCDAAAGAGFGGCDTFTLFIGLLSPILRRVHDCKFYLFILFMSDRILVAMLCVGISVLCSMVAPIETAHSDNGAGARHSMPEKRAFWMFLNLSAEYTVIHHASFVLSAINCSGDSFFFLFPFLWWYSPSFCFSKKCHCFRPRKASRNTCTKPQKSSSRIQKKNRLINTAMANCRRERRNNNWWRITLPHIAHTVPEHLACLYSHSFVFFSLLEITKATIFGRCLVVANWAFKNQIQIGCDLWSAWLSFKLKLPFVRRHHVSPSLLFSAPMPSMELVGVVWLQGFYTIIRWNVFFFVIQLLPFSLLTLSHGRVHSHISTMRHACERV